MLTVRLKPADRSEDLKSKPAADAGGVPGPPALELLQRAPGNMAKKRWLNR